MLIKKNEINYTLQSLPYDGKFLNKIFPIITKIAGLLTNK